MNYMESFVLLNSSQCNVIVPNLYNATLDLNRDYQFINQLYFQIIACGTYNLVNLRLSRHQK